MSSPSASTAQNGTITTPALNMRRGIAILRREIVGLAEDFWKDGNWESATAPNSFGNIAERLIKEELAPKPKASSAVPKAPTGIWHAAPGEISEKMWGEGCVTPADDYMTDLLIKPLSLTKDMSALDLAAGLGARMRKTTEEYGTYINGREPDPEIAARGMALSVNKGLGKHAAITAYDPMSFTEPRKYDCVVARETLYRVADKKMFVSSIVDCCKPQVQVSFTDYIVNPESQKQPAILAWKAYEKGANPPSLVEMAELWAKAGISLRVHDDQTEYYKKEVKRGLVRFAKFMAHGVRPDAETKKSIEKRIMTWAHRMAAMDQGLKFYRFYGIR